MSASMRPTRAPCCASAIARLDATVDFPTPPLPLEIAMMLPKWGYATGVGARTPARFDVGSCPITGSAREGALLAAGGDDGGRVEGEFDCEASFTSTRTSVTPSTC